MSKVANLQKESLAMLKQTSRTFFIPISFLDPVLKKTVGSAYLCMRAIDEIEDHPELPAAKKIFKMKIAAVNTLIMVTVMTILLYG